MPEFFQPPKDWPLTTAAVDPPLFEAGDGEHRAACLLLRNENVNGAG